MSSEFRSFVDGGCEPPPDKPPEVQRHLSAVFAGKPPEVQSFNVSIDVSTKMKNATGFDWKNQSICALLIAAVSACLGAFIAPKTAGTHNNGVVVTGSRNTCLYRPTGVKCWGNNDYGQLGIGDKENRGGKDLPHSEDIDLGFHRFRVAGVTVGERHACAWNSRSWVKCWGANDDGLLGYGDQGELANRGDRPGTMGEALPFLNLGTDSAEKPLSVKKVCAGTSHSCAILATRERATLKSKAHGVKCWGNGDLGYGDDKPRGQNPEEMGDNLPFVDLGIRARSIIDIACGGRHTCVALRRQSDTNQTVQEAKCWGTNNPRGVRSGVLGAYGVTKRHVGRKPGEMGANLKAVRLAEHGELSSIFSGRSSNCVIFKDGQAKCWGDNSFGQLGYGDQEERSNPNSVPYLKLEKKAEAFGIYANGACVLVGGGVRCWGKCSGGVCGSGPGSSQNAVLNMKHNPDLTFVVDGKVATARGIACGDLHTCVTMERAPLRCWGSNDDGQLGLSMNDSGIVLESIDQTDPGQTRISTSTGEQKHRRDADPTQSSG